MRVTLDSSIRRLLPTRHPRGFTVVELMMVLTLIGIMTALIVPNIDTSRHKADAAAMQVRAVLQQARRTAVSNQHEVIVSFDTANRRMRVVEDRNNDRRIQGGDRVRWIALEDAIRFVTPSVGVTGAVASAVVGSTTTPIDGLPSLIFRRDGSVHAEAQVYLRSDGRRAYSRAITVNKSIGRVSWFRQRYGQTTWDEASY